MLLATAMNAPRSESQIVRKPYPRPGKQDQNGLEAAL
jgi:hypothetical protein